MDGFKKYGKPILGFLISTGIVFGSMNIQLLMVISPIFVFLVFKMLKIWKTKERAIYGIPAIVVGIVVFFLVYSYTASDIAQQSFENGDLKAIIEPYSTSYMNKSFDITATYKGITHKNLTYVVTNIYSKEVVERSEVSGVIKDNNTIYHFKLQLDRGIYNITMRVDNESLLVLAIKEKPLTLFEKYMLNWGGWEIIAMLVALYALFIFGVHMIRKSQKMGPNYNRGKK